MFKTNKNNDNNHDLNTIISPATKLFGDICFQGRIQVDGEIIGNLIAGDNSSSMVIVSKSGVITGEISAPIVSISGNVTGNIHSSKSIKLSSSANIDGDLFYNLIEIEPGSQIKGRLMHSYLGSGKDISTMPKNRTTSKPKLISKEPMPSHAVKADQVVS